MIAKGLAPFSEAQVFAIMEPVQGRADEFRAASWSTLGTLHADGRNDMGAIVVTEFISLDGVFEDAPPAKPAELRIDEFSLGLLPGSSGATRLAVRFNGNEAGRQAAEQSAGQNLDAAAAARLGLVTQTPDDLDWEDELRLVIEERASFSPDALTGMEANLRFAGPETADTKIFGRLSAWQNWIFQRPNAAGPQGALRRYGTGQRADYDRRRV